ncbi:unnamed protein product [Hydatigera taeniaeformis]|uniref:LHFPL tetraspan subfamily member 4b n=1 Tax=Hydatigena taeniaeformis TaxID=6205 RepID=A0A158REE9_HYDTA|nr:unnamed protein product [Hydatigera taeniaeformis]
MTPQWQIISLLLIWSLLTVLVAGVCSTCCLLPFWVAGSVELPAIGGRVITSVSHLGLFRRCGYPTYQSNGDVEWIQGCGYYPELESVPHWVWRMALVLLIIAACLLVFLAFFVICAGACTSLLRKNLKLSRVCSYVHLVAGEIVLHDIGTRGLRVMCVAFRSLRGWLGIRADNSMRRNQRGFVGNAEPSAIPPAAQYLIATVAINHFHSHLSPPWYTTQNSVFFSGGSGGVGGGINCSGRRRPHSLIVPPDPSSMCDLTRRLSCSTFWSIPEQEQSEMPPIKRSECHFVAVIPEDEVDANTAEGENNDISNDDKSASGGDTVS